MKLRKILAIALSALMVGGTASFAASAQEVKTAKTYNYVALGDSIAAGYGLGTENGLENDPALILSDKLIANPVKEAYAAVFGTYLQERAEGKGVTVNATNLSTTAYRAEDVAETILTEGYKGGIATWIFETFNGEGSSQVLVPYHDIFAKYLPEADLVSIQLGGNDIIMGVLSPILVDGSNPILQAAGLSMALTLFGYDPKLALGAGLKKLEASKDEITKENLMEAAAFVSNVAANSDAYVENAAGNVQKVVDAVKTVNENAEIALIGMFNPYGNSLEYQGQYRDAAYVFSAIVTRAANELCAAPEEETTEPEEPVEEITEPESISYEKTIELKVDLTKVKSMIAVMKQIKENAKAGLSTMLKTIYDAYSAKLNALMKIVAEESAYSVQYMLLGKGCEAQMLYLNELLAEMAETNDATYVDVYYGVSNEQNLNPHPLASGHKEIADVMNDVLFDLTEAQIDEIAGGEEELQPLVNNSTISKTEIKLGEKLKIRAVAEGGAGDYQYEVYYKKVNSTKWSRVHDYSYLYAFNITPATATQYEVRINVKDKNGEVETKILTFDVVK